MLKLQDVSFDDLRRLRALCSSACPIPELLSPEQARRRWAKRTSSSNFGKGLTSHRELKTLGLRAYYP